MTPNFPRTQGNMMLFYDVKDCKRKNGECSEQEGKLFRKEIVKQNIIFDE